MERSRNMVIRRGRRNCRWSSDNCGSWNWSARNEGLCERTGGHLTEGHFLAFVVAFHRRNLFVIGGRSWILIFFRLFLQFNYLRGRRNEVVVEGFLYFGNEFTRRIQVPTTSHQMHAWKFCKLHRRVHTKIWVVIDPILKEWRQGWRKKSIWMYLQFEENENKKMEWKKWKTNEDMKNKKKTKMITSKQRPW